MNAAEQAGSVRFRKCGLAFRGCVLVLAIVWMWAGVWKILNWATFVGIVGGHEVVPQSFRRLIWIVPAAEVGLGGALAGLASPAGDRNTALGWIVGSALALAKATIYVWLVPAQIIQTLGCGCRPSLLPAGTSIGGKSEALALNAILFGLHFACLGLAGTRERTSAMLSK